MSKATDLRLIPRVSEKTFGHAKALNVYTFRVPTSANAKIVKEAVESQFAVQVKKVNVLVSKGKKKKSMRKRRQPLAGRRSDFKKAYVTLKKGDKIPVFEEVE